MPSKKSLVIVESPTKAKTISKFLGSGFKVMSSFGHIRDLPKKELGIDTENGFRPRYVIPTKSKKVASELKKEAAKSNAVYFASDEDREGEAIAWHLSELLGLKEGKSNRITFHEITKSAIDAALANPRNIDRHLVDAQQARRILDRLVGYRLSPFLWKKVARGLSAGRVQSVAVRLIVEREREIGAFKPQEYWTIEANLRKSKTDGPNFLAKLVSVNDRPLDKFGLPDEKSSQTVIDGLKDAEWRVGRTEKKTVFRAPPPPYTTSTLQQDANNKLNFSAKMTMMLAQQLYEGIDIGGEHVGLITYMRTDSVNLAEKFIEECRSYLQSSHGGDSVPDSPRRFKTKSKNAQEAHEAIRPTDVLRHPNDVRAHLNERQRKLYELIWRRAVASQMVDAEMLTTSAEIRATADGFTGGFRANGKIVVREGYRILYEKDADMVILPEMDEGQALETLGIDPKQHFTEPPPRYNEASLVKALEENAIGRPSTYAPIISTIVDRGYVQKEGKALQPTELASIVTDLLVEHFPNIVDVKFTAGMEERLDEIAEGEKEWEPVIENFYRPFEASLKEKEATVPKRASEPAEGETCEKCGKPMLIKIGRFGKFLACSGFPECKSSRPLPGTEPGMPNDGTNRTDEKCEKCGADMVVRRGRFGEFLSCSAYPDCKSIKPLVKKTGVKCPECGEGDIAEKRTRTGRVFYACSRYPSCKFALWNRPTGETCPSCRSLLTFAKGDRAKCSNKECGFEKDIEKGEE
ncbi:type I DNA topoisomerase [Candidatus Uhrbacteria bacterium]|nr:type I DNA topoisomerase [Candidatus Uhrbacteria bacterium]